MQNYLATIKLKFCKPCNTWYRESDNHPASNTHLKNTLGYLPIIETESAAKCRLKTYYLTNGEGYIDIGNFLKYHTKPLIISKIQEHLLKSKTLKCNIILKCIYARTEGEEDEIKELSFKTANEPILLGTDLNTYCKNAFDKLLTEQSEHQGKGSGWSLKSIIGLELRINKYYPLRGCKHISLPAFIANKKAVVNVKNQDDYCFKYSIWAKNVPRNPQRVRNYIDNAEMNAAYDWDCINYPVKLKSIPKFEQINNISINIFGIEKKHNSEEYIVYPIKVTKQEKDDHRDLLLLKNETTSHYVWIKNFDKLVSAQTSNHNGRKFVCKSCLIHFNDKPTFDVHKQLCNNHEPVAVEMPNEDNCKLKFKNFKHQQQVPYIVYADFESILIQKSPCNNCNSFTCKNPNECCINCFRVNCKNLNQCCLNCKRPNCKNSHTCKTKHATQNQSTSSTVDYQKHYPSSFCYYVVSSNGEKSEPVLFRGENAVKVFCQKIRDEALKVYETYKNKLPMELTDEEVDMFERSSCCHICEEQFTADNLRVRDHDPNTGKFRGASHSNCNLSYQNPHFLPVVLHNMSNYDLHFIIKSLDYDEMEIKVIPNTEERYISLSKKVAARFEIRFLDSYKFMSRSLDELVKNLDKNQFNETLSYFGYDKLNIVTKKGCFPYEYIDGWEKFNETSLPSIDQFYSSLNKSEVAVEDYNRAVEVWNKFNCQTLGEFSDIYLKTDVLLLSDVFENFRKVCKSNYGLDPGWYFTAPGLSFDACLKLTKVEIDLLTSYEQYMFIEAGIRGGISMCTKRYCEASNKYLVSETNLDSESQPGVKPMDQGLWTVDNSNFILFLDINNLYGAAMGESLPLKDFKWLTPVEIDEVKNKINDIGENDEVGFILEVDLDYPAHLHEQHNDLPFCAQRKVPPGSKHSKLLTTLEPKRNYIIHSQALKQAVEHGLVLVKIHRGMKFVQSKWLYGYIEKNTTFRKNAQNEFEKEFFKLMNNSVYGKCMENVRNRMNMEIVCSTKRLDKLIAKPNFRDRTIFTEKLIAVHLNKTKVNFNKPIAVGMAILELSKIVMYRYFYDIFPRVFGQGNVELLYTDTDSYLINVNSVDVYEQIKENIHYFDTSEYPITHACFSLDNKKRLGVMKDETLSVPLKKFIGLRTKLYTTLSKNYDCKKRAKGVKKSVVKNEITFQDYERALFCNQNQYKEMNIIRSRKHDVYTTKVRKLALSSHDDKRFVLNDNIHTMAYGHYKLIENKKRKIDLHKELIAKKAKMTNDSC